MSPGLIGIDARMWGHPGIGRYIRELVRALALECPNKNFGLVLPPYSCAGVPEGKNFFHERSHASIYGLREQLEIPRVARKFRLFHVPHFNIPLLFSGRMVVTVHDLIYFHNLQGFYSPAAQAYARFFFGVLAKKRCPVIAVSHHTKEDMLRHFRRITPDRIFVVPEAASPLFRKVERGGLLEDFGRRESLDHPFVLFVGGLKKHKNIPLLIDAMRRIRKRGLPHELILVGRPDARNTELLKQIVEAPFVRAVGERSDEELLFLYNLAEAFVMPSLYEGFGLPVLEAMGCGLPVIISKATSLPEVGGDAALYFDPRNVDALEEVLYNTLKNTELRKRMAEKSAEQAKKFSWAEAARRTADVYDRAINA